MKNLANLSFELIFSNNIEFPKRSKDISYFKNNIDLGIGSQGHALRLLVV